MGRRKLTARKEPRQERSIATVEAILQAATYILVKRGWDAFTTNEVAQKAGVNIASLYQYFPNKESIVAELQRRHVQALARHWPEVTPELSLSESLRVMLEAVVQEHRVAPALHRVFADELPRTSRVEGLHGEAQQRWADRITQQMRVPNPELAGFITRVAVHAIVHEAATERPDLLNHPQFVPELVRLLNAYLSDR